MPPRKTSLVGCTFGELTVLRKSPLRRGNGHHTFYECRCSCGENVVVSSQNLRRGDIKSCGHLRAEIAVQKLQGLNERNALGRGNGTVCATLTGTEPFKSGTSGYRGVSFNKNLNAYTAQITFQKKKHHLGVFHNPEDAHKAYLEAKDRLHMQYLKEQGYEKTEDT